MVKFTALAVLLVAAVHAETLPREYTCGQAKTPLTIDGKLDDPAWAKASWTTDFADILGGDAPKPRFRTRAKLLWDAEYLYIGAELEEPHVWGTLTQHDSVIFHDNDFEVFLDPDGQARDYLEFEMNALNTGWDLRLDKPYRQGGKAHNDWEIPGLRTAVYVKGTLNNSSDRDEYWSVEIAMPWKALGVYAHTKTPPAVGDQWRINFSRVEWQHEIVDSQYKKIAGKREDNWVWSPQGVVNMHVPEKWGFVKFAE